MRKLLSVFMAILLLTAMPCYGKGLFSFFNPEVTVPVEVKPIDSDISGIKSTITIGSLGSIITSHLALVVMGFLLYAAIRRLNPRLYEKTIELKRLHCIRKIEKARLRSRK